MTLFFAGAARAMGMMQASPARRMLKACLGALLLCAMPALALAATSDAGSAATQTAGLVAVPALHQRVTDLTGTLTPQQQATLESKLADFEKQKGSQIAVLIVPTTQPEAIEQYSIRVTDQWKLGRKGVDDGVLLLVAKDDHRARIEVGYGLEGAIPDAGAKRIVDDDIIPHFRSGDFYGGIDAGITRIIGVINGEPLPAPPPQSESHSPSFDPGFALFLGLVILVVAGGVLRAIFGRVLGSGIASGIVVAIAWFAVGSLVMALVIGVFAFLFSMGGIGRGGGGLSGGGFGGFGGGGFGGGGGGGFSGGGGGFGGGGASGSW